MFHILFSYTFPNLIASLLTAKLTSVETHAFVRKQQRLESFKEKYF